jgi:ribokinase
LQANGPPPGTDSKSEERFLRIKRALEKMPGSPVVTVLPDYYVDRFVRLENFTDLASAIEEKGVEGGGGSIRGIRQSEVKGGNAVNLAYALGSLGVRTNLITVANSLPAEMLRSTFQKLPQVNLQLVEGDPGFTVAFEFRKNQRIVNVMVSDSGDVKNFDPSWLDSNHWAAIASSGLVGLVNWSAIARATELTESVFDFAKQKGIETFFDPADVSEKADDLPELKKRVLDRGLIKYFSMNDNEARIMSRTFAGHRLAQDYSSDDLQKTIQVLADVTGQRVDIHTHRFSMSCCGREVCVAACHKLEQKTVTGAGDVWDAADLVGYKAGLDDEERLILANGAAGLYVSREDALVPGPPEVLDFLLRNAAGRLTAAQS